MGVGWEGTQWEVPEISLCWRSLTGEPVVWWGAGCGGKDTSFVSFKPLGILPLRPLSEILFRFFSQTVLLPSGSKCGQHDWNPRAQLPALLCPWLVLLCAGSWEGRKLDLASPPNSSRKRKGEGLWVGEAGMPVNSQRVGPFPLICQVAECWSQVFFFRFYKLKFQLFPTSSLVV